MARYRDGLRVAVTIFEAAAWHYAVRVTCAWCPRSATFNPHGLWWHFHRRGLDDRLSVAHRRFWCRDCAARLGGRVAARPLEIVRESAEDVVLTLPPENEWKRMINRFRN